MFFEVDDKLVALAVKAPRDLYFVMTFSHLEMKD